ncbi:MAG: methyltransferase domain-containing protein [Candidatus Aenigmatarchaeota archaeon]
MKRFLKNKKILNVGCGRDTYGTDFVDKYPARVEVKKVDVDKEKLPYPNNFFDEVYSKNLLEHLTNPGFALKEMYRVLKKGGRIVLITDNASYWVWCIGRTHHGGYRGFKEDKHYCLFVPEHLVNYFKRLGLKRVRFKFISRSDNFLVFLIDKILQLTPFRRMGFKQFEIIGFK